MQTTSIVGCVLLIIVICSADSMVDEMVPEATFSESPSEPSANEFMLEDVPVPELTQQLLRHKFHKYAGIKRKLKDKETKRAGGAGGHPVEGRCPPGSYIDLWKVRSGSLVDNIQGRCSDKQHTWLRSCGGAGGHERLSNGSHPRTIIFRAGAVIDRFANMGGHGGTQQRLTCPVGYQVAGYKMRCGSLVDSIKIICGLNKNQLNIIRNQQQHAERIDKAAKAKREKEAKALRAKREKEAKAEKVKREKEKAKLRLDHWVRTFEKARKHHDEYMKKAKKTLKAKKLTETKAQYALSKQKVEARIARNNQGLCAGDCQTELYKAALAAAGTPEQQKKYKEIQKTSKTCVAACKKKYEDKMAKLRSQIAADPKVEKEKAKLRLDDQMKAAERYRQVWDKKTEEINKNLKQKKLTETPARYALSKTNAKMQFSSRAHGFCLMDCKTDAFKAALAVAGTSEQQKKHPEIKKTRETCREACKKKMNDEMKKLRDQRAECRKQIRAERRKRAEKKTKRL